MLFNSMQFIFVFMTAFLLSYFLFDIKYRNIIILLYSIAFYFFNSINNPINIIVLIFIILINYIVLYLLFVYYNSKFVSRILVILIIFINIALMFIFKLGILGISLPIGFSFYIFHIISLVIDISKYYNECYINDLYPINKAKFHCFISYVLFFPKILSGPITRYDKFIYNFKNDRIFKIDNIVNGFIQFSIGLGLKVLLSDNLLYVINQINVYGYESISLPTAWIGVYSFTLKLYFDFSGYSLMAIGISKLLNFDLPINFNFPFLAVSVTDFYRRWHITLMNFFKDYIYIPLGGNCNGNVIKQIRNIFVVWLLTSLWHGMKINYIIWGMLSFIIISFEKLFLLKFFNKYKVVGHIFIIVFVPLTFLVFSIEDINGLLIYLLRLISINSFNNISDFKEIFHDFYKIILISFLFITPLPKILYDKLYKHKKILLIISIIIFILSVIFINILETDTFKYFTF